MTLENKMRVKKCPNVHDSKKNNLLVQKKCATETARECGKASLSAFVKKITIFSDDFALKCLFFITYENDIM